MQVLYITYSPTGLVGNSKILGESSGSENPGRSDFTKKFSGTAATYNIYK